ncbi:YadA-like family protein [Moraxella catarrhalis]|uniref:YadA-like family protein n=1 Tax=Moraxella catarrhalis TaxID=480 RepID=UPI00237FDBAD|nr:YadA-like family protein [Moraxella catarrhalis]MDE4519454.1 cell surface protein [Moraxella catarrhalis]
MNKIYKVKKNAAGHLVACSEFAKGHTKKAVLGSLLIVGILGMATTASAQKTSSTTSSNKGEGAYIGGDNDNEAKGKYSFIGSGYFNTAEGEKSTIGGGDYNQAEGTHSTIGGGSTNITKGTHSTIGGGYGNQAEGEKSTIGGGYRNQAKGVGSFAAGIDNKANTDNAVALGKKNTIEGKNSVAIGSENTVAKDQENVFILGSNTKGAQSGSVLLGHNTAGKTATAVSKATVNNLNLEGFAGASDTNGVVSVGSENSERQIVNVGAGQISATSTDAVNGSQLYVLGTAVAQNKADIATNKADIDKNKADIKANSSKITNLGTLHSMVARAVGANKGRIDQNKADIQDLDAEVGLLGEEINSLEGEIFNNQDAIAKNQADIKTLESNVEEGLLDLSGRLIDQKADIDNNINNIYELAQQQDQHSSDIKTLKNNVEEGLLDLSGRLIDQKADIAKNQADIAQNQTDIQDLAAYNELQDQYAQKQTEAIDALNKASSENTQNIAKNQADIANNIKNIYELAQQQDQHSSDIKTLAKVSAANTDRIAKNKAEADASFETLTKNQNTLIEQGEALVEQNKAINQELEGFAAHADVQDKQILQNQADITTNKTAIEQNINRTVANGFEIEKNKAGIATNKQELILQNDRLNRINETNNHQDQKIDQLGYALKEQGQHFNNRISAVERQTAGGIANAIAIATLPSPSRAGEHHVLFGSGYHNGQAAVSLGAAGLSDTGKSTYKIGLSWSDAGGLSGGVGGSYRWK